MNEYRRNIWLNADTTEINIVMNNYKLQNLLLSDKEPLASAFLEIEEDLDIDARLIREIWMSETEEMTDLVVFLRNKEGSK